MFVVVDKDDKTLVASALQLGYELKKLQRDEWQLSHEYYFTIHQHNCTTYRINPVQVKPWQWHMNTSGITRLKNLNQQYKEKMKLQKQDIFCRTHHTLDNKILSLKLSASLPSKAILDTSQAQN